MPANTSLIVQVRRGTTAQTASYTGPLAELIVDTDQKLLTIQDGVTAGGIYLAPLAFAQAAFAAANSALISTTGQFAFDKANSANVLAQSAYDQANTANSLAQGSYNFANTVNAYAYSANTFLQANDYITLTSARSYTDTANTFLQANDASTLTSAKSYTDTANTNLKAYSDFTYFTKSGGTVSGNVTVQQDLTVLGNVAFTGNVTSYQVTGNTGQFFGYSSNGFNALYAGIPSGYLIQPQMITQFNANYNGYAGVNHQNINSGANSSSDVFLTADNGTFLEGYVDIGIASSSYNYPDYSLIGPNDGYFLVAGNTATGGGDLIIATELQNDIIFAVNGVNTANDMMRLSAANTNLQIYSNRPSVNTGTGSLVVTGGVGVSGNVYATGIYDNGIELGNYANTINAYAYSANTFLQANDAVIYQYTVSAFNKANSANILAQAAFDKANTGGGGTSSGYTANSVIFANTTGYLSNTNILSYYTSNNTLVSANANISTSLFVAYGPSNGLVDIAKIALAQSFIV
jgi:hypothetical protein